MPNEAVTLLDLRPGDLIAWEVKGSPKKAFYGKWAQALILRVRARSPTTGWALFEVLIAKAHPELSMKPGSVIYFSLEEEQPKETWKLLSRSDKIGN